MIEIQQNSLLKYLLFGSLYFTEGLNKVIGVLILPIYFNEKGVPPEIITLVIGIAATPMIIKFIWGGITDYFIKYGRKRFILLGGLMSSIGLFMVAFIDPGAHLIPFAIIISFIWCGVGFLDVSADALAIEISTEKERGKINGAMYAGQNIGMAMGAVLLPYIAHITSYNIVFFSAGLIILLIIIFPLFVKEHIIEKTHEKLTNLLINEFKKKTTIIMTLFALAFGSSAGMLLFLAPLYMDNVLNLNLSQVGLITMVFTIAMAIGSILGGIMTDRWGRKKTLFVLLTLTIVFSALLIYSDNWQNFTIIYSIIGFLQGGYFVAALALFMDVTNPRIGATQFSIFMGVGNLGNLGIAAFSGTILKLLSYDHIFLFAAWMCGPAILILYFIRIKSSINKT